MKKLRLILRILVKIWPWADDALADLAAFVENVSSDTLIDAARAAKEERKRYE